MLAADVFFRCRIMGAVLAVVLLSACDQQLGTLASCEKYSGAYNVAYVGHALGKGRLTLKASEQRKDILESQLTLWDETGTDAVLNLVGPGSCEEGLISLRFGSADHPQSRVRVLGGTATIVPPQGKVAELFGTWNAETELKQTGAQRSLTGFFRQTDENDMPEKSREKSQSLSHLDQSYQAQVSQIDVHE